MLDDKLALILAFFVFLFVYFHAISLAIMLVIHHTNVQITRMPIHFFRPQQVSFLPPLTPH